MVEALPAVEVLRYYFDKSFEPALPAMCLHWEDETPETPPRIWELPEGVTLVGPPRRFGLTAHRRAEDVYAVRLLWDRTCLSWAALNRRQLLDGDLNPLLAAVGTDLWSLLDRPVRAAAAPPHRAA